MFARRFLHHSSASQAMTMPQRSMMSSSLPRRGWISSWLGGASQRSRSDAAEAFKHDVTSGLGGPQAFRPSSNDGTSGGEASDGHVRRGSAEEMAAAKKVLREGFGSGGGAIPEDETDAILRERAEHLMGPRRRPVSYDLMVQNEARHRKQRAEKEVAAYSKDFDEHNMPREPSNVGRKRASWEFVPTPEHKSLVLLFYRNILKGLMQYKSVRRRSMLAYARMCFRRRATATEKLLIDECIEECRRAIYILEKHHNFTITRNYEFDSMALPKDTGQDVKTYMEEVYDPEVSRQQFQNISDVQPGKEDAHRQGMSPTSAAKHWKDQRSVTDFKVEIRDEDRALRPPPPPEMHS